LRRWTLLLAGAALWLFLAAVPALADGGPHVAAANSGVSTLTADNCAGCHRAHTAQGALLLVAPEEEICLTCHGAASTGATTDVVTGVQYVLGADGLRGTTQLGALRNGGFDQARIGSGNVYRITTTSASIRTKVPVIATPQDVTSAHIALTENGLTLPGVAWGNGAISATPDAGPAMSLSCGSCHNPHGNGQYRILNPIPGDGNGPLVEDTSANIVTDAALPPAGDTRNYTVIQRPVASAGGPLLLASQVTAGAYSPLAGDYFHRGVWWDTRDNNDAPNGIPAGTGTSFNDQITQWCSSCHTRYYSTDDGTGNTGDAIYKYQHNTQSNRACTTCHVSHGSNASMAADPVTGTTFSQNATYPNDTVSASSRLLKIDRRGTCQACHDPTGTFPASSSSGPVPNPLRP
jgi:predicted CXXCH cytochrome family protein